MGRDSSKEYSDGVSALRKSASCLKLLSLLLVLMLSLLLECYKVCIWPCGFAKHICAIPRFIVLRKLSSSEVMLSLSI